MIYKIQKYNLSDLLENERLISSIMQSNPILTTSDAKDKIQFAYEKCSGFVKPAPIKSNDHAPCQNCGSIDFQRTGTCFVCLNCQESQGCS